MKRILLIAISIGVLLLLLFLIIGHSAPKDLDERAGEALEYCKENGYSTEYCMLVDLNLFLHPRHMKCLVQV